MKSSLFKKLFFVYKITVLGHRMSYVGVTNNFDSRKSHHIKCIYEAAKKIKSGKKSIEVSSQCYLHFARYIVDTFNNTNVQSKLKIRIIDIFDCPYEASKCEHENIFKAVRYGHNLNVIKGSNYVRNKKFIIQHPIKKYYHPSHITICQNGYCKFYSTKN